MFSFLFGSITFQIWPAVQAPYVLPAVHVSFSATDSVLSVLLRLLRNLVNGDDYRATFGLRKEAGQCWAFICQFRGRPEEILLALPFRVTEGRAYKPHPVLAVRQGNGRFDPIKPPGPGRTPHVRLGHAPTAIS